MGGAGFVFEPATPELPGAMVGVTVGVPEPVGSGGVAAGSSVWPIVVAAGIAGIAGIAEVVAEVSEAAVPVVMAAAGWPIPRSAKTPAATPAAQHAAKRTSIRVRRARV